MSKAATNNKLIFGNIVNHLMIGEVEEKYAKGMNLVMSRKIWLARPNDVIVIPTSIRDDFKAYVLNLIDVDEQDLTIISVDGSNDKTLIERITEQGKLDELKEAIKNHSDISFFGFAYDEETLNFAKELEMSLYGYPSYPSQESVDLFYRINTKQGFRSVAKELHLTVSEGVFCENEHVVPEAIWEMLQKHGKVILKFNRSSNGFGHLVFDTAYYSDKNQVEQDFEKHLDNFPKQPREFIVEKYNDFVNLPSLELEVTEKGASELYTCDQFCYNNSWAGMITPPTKLTEDQYAALQHAGKVFGKYVHEKGFRGICDIDGGITTDGLLILTESNFRRTGGTYLDTIVRRLVDPDYYAQGSCYWIADSKLSKTEYYTSFDQIIEEIKKKGILFDKEKKEGVILTSMTYEHDSKWRYLIIGKTEEYVTEKERELGQLLNFLN